jgi:hypothetical protein
VLEKTLNKIKVETENRAKLAQQNVDKFINGKIKDEGLEKQTLTQKEYDGLIEKYKSEIHSISERALKG